MKAISNFRILIALLLGIHLCRAQQAITSQSSAPPPTAWSATIIDGNSTSYQRTEYEQGPNGQVVAKQDSYIETASGLNHQTVDGQWVRSVEEIDALPDGSAIGSNCAYTVSFPSDIYNGKITLTPPSGSNPLISQPIALAYSDESNSVIIAVLTNSTGQLISSDQWIYANSFVGITADVLFSYTKSGLEQNIIIRSQLPDPAKWGLSQNTRLQMLTEFFGSPQPAISTAPLPTQAEASMSDESLDFGEIKMLQGRAFLLGTDATDTGVWVSKSWIQDPNTGRTILVEQVPLSAIADQLATLPQLTAKTGRLPSVASHVLRLPPQHLAKANAGVHRMQISRSAVPSKGLVIDYNALSGSITNYDFTADNTFYISGNVTLSGTNTFEGDTVIKFARGCGITLAPAATANWIVGAYRPVNFTAVDDNTVGVTISGSSGSPSGYYANAALDFSGTNIPTISDARIAYAQTGVITAAGNSEPYFYDDQFIKCQYAGQFSGSAVYLRNVLFANVQTNFVNLGATNVDIQNATFNNIATLARVSAGAPSLFFTNCVFAGVTNYGSASMTGGYNGFYNSTAFGANEQTSAVNPFQTVGGGSHYLTNGCVFHNAGTTNIDPDLLADIATETTYPPIVYSNVSISVPTLSPQAQRDNTGDPDLGYHYDVLDYVFGGCDLYSNLNVTAGTAIGFFQTSGHVSSDGEPYSLSLNNGANFTATGTATAPVWIPFTALVQEGCNGLWTTTGWMGGFMFDGSGSGEPQLNATFTRFSDQYGLANVFRDNWARGECMFLDSEFYGSDEAAYDMQSVVFTNCMFFRGQTYFFDQDSNPNLNLVNCTAYDGIFVFVRTSPYGPAYWVAENNAFDGTAFFFNDYLSANTSYTTFNYNAYNTNNLSWKTYPYGYGTPIGTLETVGPKDMEVGGYNWESSWFGNYYLPTNSPLIHAGSTYANLLGLYHFTITTNQVVEGTNIVSIGYHYVATDQYGNPLDSNGDEIPDYLEDANGDGIFDAGDLADWQISPYGLSGANGGDFQVFTPLK